MTREGLGTRNTLPCQIDIRLLKHYLPATTEVIKKRIAEVSFIIIRQLRCLHRKVSLFLCPKAKDIDVMRIDKTV